MDLEYQLKGEGRGDIEEDLNKFSFPMTGNMGKVSCNTGMHVLATMIMLQ